MHVFICKFIPDELSELNELRNKYGFSITKFLFSVVEN